MKPRRVLVTLEIETDLPLSRLRDAGGLVLDVYDGSRTRERVLVIQAQANVVRYGKTKGKTHA